MVDDPSRYLSYLLRLWLATGDDEITWRALLEDPVTGERQGFLSLEALFAFILEQTQPIKGINNTPE